MSKDYQETKDLQYKKSMELWIKAQENYIKELELRKDFAVRDFNHFNLMIEHEKTVLQDYIQEVGYKQ